MESIGRYRITRELGRGAMGVVYHATDPSIGRPVAIKTIRIRDINDTQQRDKLRERLFREARSAGVLSHPNIVTIYDMDEVDDLAYIAMAYVEGPTLEKILASETPLSGASMLRILRQTASALDYAHGRGIVHRDIKPANIMTDEDGAAKITDFGIAKITAEANLTQTRSVVGTPNYMSPEQVQGHEVDGRSDQFSLAVIAYEILTGERPFTGEHLSTIVFRIVTEEPAEANRINGTLTPRINEVLRRALSKKPEDRFPNCSNFVGALEMACAESRGWTTLAVGSSGGAPTIAVERHEAPPGVEPALATPEPASRPSRLVPILVGIALVAALTGVFGWSRQSERAPEPLPAAEQKAAPANIAPEQSAVSPAPVPPRENVADTPAPEVEGPPVQTASPIFPLPEIRERVHVPATDAVPRAARAPRMQEIRVTTNPEGTKVVLDADIAGACTSPCVLHAQGGIHHLTYSRAGYQNEYREIHVGDDALYTAAVTMRQTGGTLMLTTSPVGANIQINGQPFARLTPAQINLAPGSYSITVERDGISQTQRVEIHESPVYLRIPLNQ